MTRILSFLFVLLCVSVFSTACGNNSPGNPVGPSPTPEPITIPPPTPEPPTFEPPTPEPTLVSLTGMVRSNTGNPLNGAMVTILDGVNAGRTTTADTNGKYKFDDLTVGNGNLSAVAVGYQEARAGVHINGTNTLDLILEPANYAGTWVGNGTGTASDGSPISVEIELQIVGSIGNFVVDLWKVSYKFRDLPSPAPANWCYHNSPFTGRLQIPVIENSFSRTRDQNDVFTYTPTVLKGTFTSAVEVKGEVTLVRNSRPSYKECPQSVTIKWEGRRR